ncbi:MAG: fibro-slime domain-containing protein [Myxococcales bacterium]|nr:MAG: fibro-slime domain-containing protein [Myxococcales bacterium]
MHITFQYLEGTGQTFRFRGDDDLWVFMNDKLVIDLGGPHNPQDESVNLDDLQASLALVDGEVYPLELFHAERHTCGSNFLVETTFKCLQDVPTDVF